MKCLKSFYPSLATTSPPQINPKITSSIFMANYSPLSSENHRSLFVKPAKRGKQRAGGEALFAFHDITFNYQQRHPHNVLTTQLGTSCSFDSPGLARNEPTPGKHPQGDSTPTALFHTNHVLTQGSLHYRLATLGYQKHNTYGVETFIL